MGLELSQSESPTSSWRLILTLGVAGFFSGLLLVGVYLTTLPIIEANKARALKAAVFQVIPGCETFQTLVWQKGRLVLQSSEDSGQPAPSSQGSESIFVCYDASQTLLGFAIPGSEPGFQDLIEGLFGYDAGNQLIVGFEVLESRETPGLGDKIIKNENFRANFTALAIAPEIVPVKPGAKQQTNQVETITGATISSKAVVRLIQKSLNRWRPAIEAWLQEEKK